jgi:cell division protein FtsN
VKEFVLWATPKGAESWEEVLITSTKDKEHLKKARAWAKANGFTNLRVSEFKEGEMPDFKGTINK